MNKLTLSDILKLSEDEFNWLKQTVKEEEQRRGTSEFEVVELIRIDDGCEGYFITVDDFQECARKKYSDEGWDLIDTIEHTLFQGSDIHIYKDKFPIDELGNEYFFGKENPYYKPHEDDEEDY